MDSRPEAGRIVDIQILNLWKTVAESQVQSCLTTKKEVQLSEIYFMDILKEGCISLILLNLPNSEVVIVDSAARQEAREEGVLHEQTFDH